MKRIWKYSVEILNSQNLLVPRSSKVLSVGETQVGRISIWVEFDESDMDADKFISWTLHVVATGQRFELANRGDYIGTVVTRSGLLVWHVFQEVTA